MFQTAKSTNPAPGGDVFRSPSTGSLWAGLSAFQNDFSHGLVQVRETLLGVSVATDLWQPIADWQVD